ncbi:MAG: GIY-YIG nuclease family protein [Methanobacteriota archaeon]
MIGVAKLLGIEEFVENIKVHMATEPGDAYRPLKEYEAGIESFKKWQDYQGNDIFKRKYVASFVQYRKNVWLFVGVWEIKGFVNKPRDKDAGDWANPGAKIRYNSSLTSYGKDLVGRLLIDWVRTQRDRNSYRNGENFFHQLGVKYIKEKKHETSEYPGPDDVHLTHSELTTIVDKEVESWKVSLSYLKGVYLIMDNKTGKGYVGSATGEDYLWQRWCQYAKTGHGGNKLLVRLLKKEGDDYADNFTFSLLQVFNPSVDDNVVIERESFWKSVLLTRDFGYNDN